MKPGNLILLKSPYESTEYLGFILEKYDDCNIKVYWLGEDKIDVYHITDFSSSSWKIV